MDKSRKEQVLQELLKIKRLKFRVNEDCEIRNDYFYDAVEEVFKNPTTVLYRMKDSRNYENRPLTQEELMNAAILKRTGYFKKPGREEALKTINKVLKEEEALYQDVKKKSEKQLRALEEREGALMAELLAEDKFQDWEKRLDNAQKVIEEKGTPIKYFYLDEEDQASLEAYVKEKEAAVQQEKGRSGELTGGHMESQSDSEVKFKEGYQLTPEEKEKLERYQKQRELTRQQDKDLER